MLKQAHSVQENDRQLFDKANTCKTIVLYDVKLLLVLVQRKQ